VIVVGRGREQGFEPKSHEPNMEAAGAFVNDFVAASTRRSVDLSAAAWDRSDSFKAGR